MPKLINYLLGPGKHNEHERPHVVAAAEAVDTPHGRILTGAERQDLSDQLDWSSQMHGTGKEKRGHVWHVSFTADPHDREITDADWSSIVHRVMTEMGVDDPARASASWVAISHGQNKAGAQHVHVALNLVRHDGRNVNLWGDLKKLSSSLKLIERDYGLNVVTARWQKGTGVPGLTQGELGRAQRSGNPETDRERLERSVRAAASLSESEAEFVRRVTEAGVLVHARWDAEGNEVTGYAVAVAGEDGGPDRWFGGSNLKRDLGLPTLRKHWPGSAADARELWRQHESATPALTGAAAASSTSTPVLPPPVITRTRPPVSPARPEVPSPPVTPSPVDPAPAVAAPPAAPGREAVTIDAGQWDVAATRFAEVLDHLAAASAADVDTWRLAAREGAGVLAAWSTRVEAQPGPLARAAEQLARSAQAPAAQPLERPESSPLRSLRGVAMVMAQATVRQDTLTAWLLLATQALRLLEQIEAAHEAREESQRARQISEQARAELAEAIEEWRGTDDLATVTSRAGGQVTVEATPQPSSPGRRSRRPAQTPPQPMSERVRDEERGEDPGR